jgi:hypothetical protein
MIKSAQTSLASNPVLRSISNRQDVDEEPEDVQTHRSVGVDPDFYDMVDDDIIAIIIEACKPLFDLVSSPNSKQTHMKNADLIMATAKLIIAAGYKMKEQARQEMAEEDLGGGMFDEDVKDMREFAAKVPLPQVYDADEQQTMSTQLALFEAPRKLDTLRTGSKLVRAQTAQNQAGGFDVRAQMEIQASAEQIVGYLMAHTM